MRFSSGSRPLNHVVTNVEKIFRGQYARRTVTLVGQAIWPIPVVHAHARILANNVPAAFGRGYGAQAVGFTEATIRHVVLTRSRSGWQAG